MKDKSTRQLAIWLYIGTFAILIQIILGGITRLTGSGLSITEWKPLLGAIPPMNTAAWEKSFQQYQQIAQYKIVNSHFNLEDYKTIYFWEWLHRNWARMLGILFLIPYLIFQAKKQIPPKLQIHLITLFILGIMQGLIGWIMVRSGLNNTAISVSDLKLAVHFIAAIGLLSYTLWIAFHLSIAQEQFYQPINRKQSYYFLLGLIYVQLVAGAFMAGSKAALAAPTWPDMNGFVIAPDLFNSQADSHLRYLLLIQVVHRILAYLILIKTVQLWYKNRGLNKHPLSFIMTDLPLILVFIQVMLGVCSLVFNFEPQMKVFAILHQFTAIILLANVLLVCYLHKKQCRLKFNS